MKKLASSVLGGLTLLVCLGCAAQTTPATPGTSASQNNDLNRSIERHIRAQYELPAKVDLLIGPRTPSEDFPNYDKLTVTMSAGAQKKTYDFLVSKDGKTLLRVTKMDLTKDPYQAVMDKIDITGRPVRGNKDAKVTIVNFDDYQCPYCAMMHGVLTNDILKNYGDRVKIVYKDFPLTEIHPWAKHAAIDANCLAAENSRAYWNFVDDVHEHAKDLSHGLSFDQQKDKLDLLTIQQGQKSGLNMDKLQACVKAQNDQAVNASEQEGEMLGVDSTPTMFINGQKVSGALPAADIEAIINRALLDAGEQVPLAASQKPASPGM
jgi:protein-disulfide isomerase